MSIARPPAAAAVVVALAAIASAPAAALADPKSEAAAHVARATELHKESRFREALVELQAAYKLDPKPELLFALGQVHVKLGRCAEAVIFYEGYLASKPPAGPASATRQAIKTCQTSPPPPEPEPEPTPAPAPAPAPTVAPAPKPTLAPPPTDPPATGDGPQATRRPWYSDKLGLALVAAGVAGGVTGAIVYTSARSDIDASDTAASYTAAQDLADRARTKRLIAGLAGGAGVALLAGGVLHLVLADRGTEARPVALAPLPGGAALTFAGRF